MNRTLITGAGGPAAICFLQAQASTRSFTMADMDVHAAGLYLVPAARRVLLPPGDAPDFADVLLRICVERGISTLVPTVDAELLPLARRREAFEAAGIELLLAPLEALETCLDKWALHQRCAEVVPCPATTLAGEPPEGPGPWIAKPRSGSGSRGIRQVDAASLHTVPTDGDWLIQELLPGAEYSVDVLLSPAGEPLAAVPRERLKVDSGVAVVARTVADPELQALALRAAKAVGIRGVANVQLKRDRDGRPRLMEINPRFPGTMALTVAAGANLPRAALDLLHGEPIASLSWRETAIVRTFAETVVDPSVFDIARRNVA